MIQVKRIDEINDRIGEFINREFTIFGKESGVNLNYEEFCFVAENDEGQILGAITGRAYYNEVHIGDLIIGKDHRKSGIGRKLVEEVEKAFSDKGYEKITLTTFGFQAPEFYKKLGYETAPDYFLSVSGSPGIINNSLIHTGKPDCLKRWG